MKEIEQSYLDLVGQTHRKDFAQFFTPDIVAEFMRNWIFSGTKCKQIFDPAFGLGAFYTGCPEDVSFSGMDIDINVLNFFTANFPHAPVSLLQGNYLLNFGNRYQNIICNPPYLKFQHLAQRNLILREIENHFGIKLSGYVNSASAFLVKSICELEKGGRLVYIMPSEFLNTGYGKAVKELLIEKKHLYAIINIECETAVFPDVTTSLCILLYDSQTINKRLSFFSVGDISELPVILNKKPASSVPYSELNPTSKWGRYFTSQSIISISKNKNLDTLATYGHFSRGIATGANDFFVLRKSKIASWHLKGSEYIPCITKSQQISGPIFTNNDFEVLSKSDAPVFLFNAKNPISSEAKAYVDFGERQGVNNGFLTRNRSPWYKVESRAQAPILLNVFSRGGYKVVRNVSDAVTLTSFHCFYPNLWGSKYIDVLFLYLFSDVGHKILASSVRKYGRQLEKFEPNDLNNALVPSEDFFSGISQHTIERLFQNMQDGLNIKDDLTKIFLPLLC